MDTNQNVANNYQINTFTKGMNSDTSYDMIGADQYLFGLNIRITNNTLLFGDLDSNNTEMVVAPVPLGDELIRTSSGSITGNWLICDKILAADSIGNIGILIIKASEFIVDQTDYTGHWIVYKIERVEENSQIKTKRNRLYISKEPVAEGVDRFSITMIQETEGVIKVYIADGKHPVMLLFVENTKSATPINYNQITDDRLLSANLFFPTKKIVLSKISGNLKTQLVQYTYRFYRQYGLVSKLAPITNKIHVIGSNRNIEQGNAEDTVTDIGFKLKINISLTEALNLFDRVLIFRISYIKYENEPEINLIYDDYLENLKTTENSVQIYRFLDTGVKSIQKYSLDEFNALQSQSIVPDIIELSQGYLFQGNCEDRTVLKLEDINVADPTITPCWASELSLDDSGYDNIPKMNGTPSSLNIKYIGWLIETVMTGSEYFELQGIDSNSITKYDYSDIFVSSLLRSLRSGNENYRYGIIYYDKYGNHTNVKRIGSSDYVTPSGSLFYNVAGLNSVRPRGVKITVTKPSSGDIVGFLIVRCEKSFDHTKNILLVALSRPWMQGKYQHPSYRTPCYPGMYLSTLFFYTKYYASQLNSYLWGTDRTDSDNSCTYFDHAGTNVENFTLYQAFSPEINIRRLDWLSNLSQSNCKLNILDYLYENRTLSQSVASLSRAEISVDTQNLPKVKTYIGTSFTEYAFTEDTNDTDWYVTGDITFTGGENWASDLIIPSVYTNDITKIKAEYNGNWVNLVSLVSDSSSDITNHLAYDGHEFFSYYRDTDDNTVFERLCSMLTNPSRVGAGYFTQLVIKLRFPKSELANVGGGALFEHSGGTTQSLETTTPLKYGKIHHVNDYVYFSNNYWHLTDQNDKSSQHTILKLDNRSSISYSSLDYQDQISILDVADVKNPGWSDGFSNVLMGTGNDFKKVTQAVKQYKSYTSNVGSWKYNNWVSNGMYDLAPTENDANAQPGNMNSGRGYPTSWVYDIRDDNNRGKYSVGMIGPGPLCLLLNTEMPDDDSALCKHIRPGSTAKLGTLIANITHEAQPYDDNYQVYYGFGNFYEFDENDTKTVCVFDGDIYPQFAEFTNMFKAYDFKDYNKTLISGQVVYYIPLESKINVMFDYGMNYRNTQSSNLLLEPGEIEGITSLKRPLHQYNMIYSDNDSSIETFYTETNLLQTTTFPQRIWYSLLKTNGENVDNWLITRPANYIDADSRYGKLTNLLASDNNIYFWQTGAFGKLSVNERSLVTDDNGETIQLGQGGVLQRVDYLSTKYGMREQDFCAVNTEDAIFWIDILNKAILMCKQNLVVNYGELLNVQNYINAKILLDEPSSQTSVDYRPTIHYDILTNELLCQAFNPSSTSKLEQLVFNTKLGVAQAVYTRLYDDVMYFNNTVVGLNIDSEHSVRFILLNNLLKKNLDRNYLYPAVIEFAVNSSASTTKVFDNQKVVVLKKDRSGASTTNLMPEYLSSEHSAFIDGYLSNRSYNFETDLQSTTNKPIIVTDREGNICYTFPRTTSVNAGASFNNLTSYGGRMRGKWLRERITNSSPKKDECISHIITKFRQSYS